MKRLLFLLALSALPMHALGTASITEIVDERTPLLKAPTCSFCVGIEEKTNGRIRAMDLHAHVCGNQKLAGQLLVKGFWGALWAANVYLLYRLVNELRLSNDFRTTATTRGLSDLISTDLSKVGSSRVTVSSGEV